ncbi:hypothetical protein J4218_02815 [Candidatus Pacearchaeota archaeon]|nr:hypothetical protein [Candidatus Pacearchaeota archaeon]
MSEDNSLRGGGRKPAILVEGDNLAEATFNAIIACYDHGQRIETPKHRSGMSLGFDANMTVVVKDTEAEPTICFAGMYDGAEGMMQYILEVTHGIHNHWKKNEQHPEWWGYTYNERMVEQLPFVFQRIKHDWDKRQRISGRDYQFAIWRAGEDIILEQEDPPCWQLGQLRFAQDSQGNLVMNYETDWRSRDLFKAWNENNVAQLRLMKLLAGKVSDTIGQPIKMGSYIDHSSSLHLYGLYVDRDNLPKQIERMKRVGYEGISSSLEDFFIKLGGRDETGLKRLVAAQMDAEAKGNGFNQSEATLQRLGYDLSTHAYPAEWDSWPKSWDAQPDPSKLARVCSEEEILQEAARIMARG